MSNYEAAEPSLSLAFYKIRLTKFCAEHRVEKEFNETRALPSNWVPHFLSSYSMPVRSTSALLWLLVGTWRYFTTPTQLEPRKAKKRWREREDPIVRRPETCNTTLSAVFWHTHGSKAPRLCNRPSRYPQLSCKGNKHLGVTHMCRCA
ncbi:hypothetical protein V8C42DRAFT_323775 [Trichoderma barbatum]